MASFSVRNMTSPRSHRPVANQFIISITRDSGKRLTAFQSYETLICIVIGGAVYLSPEWDCSKTTAKYTAQFLGTTTKHIRHRLKEKTFYVLPSEVLAESLLAD